ncbi:MAG: hypothetical protein RL007_252 [Bacteroidota bacterium]
MNSMNKLSENWITEHTLDFEYKKYVLLAWLQNVEQHFKMIQLYPSLGELVNHYRNACGLRDGKMNLESNFPKEVKGIDGEKFRLMTEPVLQNEQIMNDIEKILEFSIPRFENSLKGGTELYEEVESGIAIFPIGISPIYKSEGYVLLRESTSTTRVYQYQVSIFESAESKWRALRTEFVGNHSNSFTVTYESIKMELIHTNEALPNPAVFAAESRKPIPVDETFLPLVKRLLIRQIAA